MCTLIIIIIIIIIMTSVWSSRRRPGGTSSVVQQQQRQRDEGEDPIVAPRQLDVPVQVPVVTQVEHKRQIGVRVGYAELFESFAPPAEDGWLDDWKAYLTSFDEQTQRMDSEAIVRRELGIVHRPCFAQFKIQLIIAVQRIQDRDNGITYVPVVLLTEDDVENAPPVVYGLDRKTGHVTTLTKSSEEAGRGQLRTWNDTHVRTVDFKQALKETLLFRFSVLPLGPDTEELDSGWQPARAVGDKPARPPLLDLFFNDDAGRHPAACFCMTEKPSPSEGKDVQLWLYPLNPASESVLRFDSFALDAGARPAFSLYVPTEPADMKLFQSKAILDEKNQRHVFVLLGLTAAEMTDDTFAITKSFEQLEERLTKLVKTFVRADEIRQNLINEWMEAGGVTIAFCVVRIHPIAPSKSLLGRVLRVLKR